MLEEIDFRYSNFKLKEVIAVFSGEISISPLVLLFTANGPDREGASFHNNSRIKLRIQRP